MKTISQILFVPPAPVVWAERQSTFARQGVTVETHQTLSSNEIGQSLSTGERDLGIAVMDNVLFWNQKFGADLRIIAQLERHTELRFIAPDADVGMAEVARHPIAIDADDNGFVLVLYRALMQAGIDWRGCRFDLVGGVKHRFEAMMKGRARSSVLIPPFDELLQARGFHTLWTRALMAPDYPGVVVVARQSWLDANGDLATAYLRALLNATQWAAAPGNRHEAVQALLDARYTPAVAEALVDAPVAGLEPSLAGWSETLALRRECALELEHEPLAAEIIATAALRQAREAAGAAS